MTDKKENNVVPMEKKDDTPAITDDVVMYVQFQGSRAGAQWEVGAKSSSILHETSQKKIDCESFEDALEEGVKLMKYVMDTEYKG